MPLLSHSRRAFLAGSAAALGAGVAGRGAQANAAYPHLTDRTVTIIVGSEVGNGNDLCGRLLAHYMEGTVSGLKFEVKNVLQAGGMLGAKFLQEGPKDGSMLFTSSTSLLHAQIMEEDGVAFDLKQWDWLGKLTTETWLLIKGPGADFANLEELRAKRTPSSMAVRSTASASYHQVLWVNAMLGTRIKPVPGYKSSERAAAVLKGEVMVTIDSYPSSGPLFDSPVTDLVLRLNDGPVPERFKGRPLLADLVADRPDLAPIVSFFEANAKLGRWFALPPGTDPTILAEWRALFEATATRPDFIADLRKLAFELDLMTGPEVAKEVESVLANQAGTKALLESSLVCGKALAEGLDNPCSNS